jgi:hypothetical protein
MPTEATKILVAALKTVAFVALAVAATFAVVMFDAAKIGFLVFIGVIVVGITFCAFYFPNEANDDDEPTDTITPMPNEPTSTSPADMPELPHAATIGTDPQYCASPKTNYVTNAIWAACGGALTLAVAMFLPHGEPKAVVPPVPPASTQPKTVQIVTLFECQYMSFSEPFFILHLPQCSNCVARSRQPQPPPGLMPDLKGAVPK